ncbi:hypothetical protein BZG36_04463 [Bifiguratus adelaidae]|uniref:N-acetylglucosamine-6-phosphate deacetylase n=1 Tax=Bifiguratus adelaidae TaxID=1938954 RepID=A0A261XVR5_9FUNG|nr:hypothetical protein BZG36_04463 [Bifiguratus adelaidae]
MGSSLFAIDTDTPIPYKEYVLAFSTLVYSFETYLSYRQYKKYLVPHRPKQLESIISKEEFNKAQAYGADKSRFGFVVGFFNQVENALMIQYNFMPWLWHLSGKWMADVAGYGVDYEITQSVIFFILFSLISTVISLPFSLYSTFVIEERHGFNKQTLGLFFTDLLKGHLLGGAIGVPVLSGFLWIIGVSGDKFYVYIWVFMLVLQFVMITIYPTLIQPLFNKVTPLEPGELRTSIEQLAARVNFPLKKLFVIDGSKRSAHSNAYFYGFFKNKRIVLYDTLLEHSGTEEVCAVLAHELGHWAKSHTVKILIAAQLHLFLLFFLFSQFIHNAALYRSFGFSGAGIEPHGMPILIGFLLFQNVYSPVESLVGFLMNVYSRKNEFEAGKYAFAKSLGYAHQLRSALIKLNVKNLGSFVVDPWYSAWNHSHPAMLERLDAIGIINCRYLANHTIVSDSYLWFEDGKFVSPQHVFFDLYRKPDEVIDAGGLLVVPGFIDVQINGAFGFDFTQDIGRLESDEEVHRALDRVSKGLLKYGCTAYCPTVISSDQEVYHRVLPFLRPRKGTHERAEILGAHIEGPFISHGKKGAHNDKVILDASVGMSVVDERYGDEVALKRGGSLPRAFGEVERAASIVTVAPEVEGIMDVIPELVKRGVVVSIGHSEAFLKDAEAAIVKGATFITHLFNAMQTFHHRDPGIIGILGSTTLPHSPHANLPSPSRTSVDKTQSDPRPFYGIICDGIHTHPNSIKIAYYGHPTGCVLITDAINALGLPAGGYNLGTGDVWVDEHARAYLKGTNTLAGSATPIDACVRKFAAFTKCTLVEAIEAATLHPAQLLGIQDRKGTLAIGADADFLIVDDSKGPENLRVERVFVGGQEARIDNIAFRGSLSMDPLVVQLEKASIEHENEETSAKEGDGETSRVSAITSKPRTSRPTRTIPRGVSRRTGPKGVLSDHADYLHSLAQDKHAKIAAPNEGVLARAPTVNTYGQELEQEQRERDAKKQALDKDDEHAEDSDDLFEEDDEAVRKYNNVRMQQLRQRRDTRLSYGSIESVSADDYADIIDTTPNGTVVLVHLYDPSLSASKALQHYLNNLSQKYIYARFLQVSAPSLNFDLVGSPAMLIYKDTRLIINLVGLSETLKERNGTTKMDLEDVEDLLLR